MDRLSQLRDEGGSRDSTLDTTSPPSETFMTANESSSKYFSLSEVDTTFDISSIKDVSLASATTDSEGTITNTEELISNLSPIAKKSDILGSYKIGKQIEAANILSGGVDIFDDNDNSYDGDELVIDDNVEVDEKSNEKSEGLFKSDENMMESTLINEETDIASKDTEVVLQIDGNNVDAIDIGNGLYLYRKAGEEELAAVQIIDDGQQQPSFKFLKVRENAEGNLEVYEEIEIEVPKEVPVKEGKITDKSTSSHVPIKDINKVMNESTCSKVVERKNTPQKEPTSISSEGETDANKDSSLENKTEVNFNGKMMKFSESRKSPVIGSFTPMTYHSTPNKEGIPLTKTMVNQQLHPNRHSDNVKKTIEVHTDSGKQRVSEIPVKNKDCDDSKVTENTSPEKEIVSDALEKNIVVTEEKVEKKPELQEVTDVVKTTNKPEVDKSVEQNLDAHIMSDTPTEVSIVEDNSEHPKISIKEQDERDSMYVEDVEDIAAEMDIEIIEDATDVDRVKEVFNTVNNVVETVADVIIHPIGIEKSEVNITKPEEKKLSNTIAKDVDVSNENVNTEEKESKDVIKRDDHDKSIRNVDNPTQEPSPTDEIKSKEKTAEITEVKNVIIKNKDNNEKISNITINKDSVVDSKSVSTANNVSSTENKLAQSATSDSKIEIISAPTNVSENSTTVQELIPDTKINVENNSQKENVAKPTPSQDKEKSETAKSQEKQIVENVVSAPKKVNESKISLGLVNNPVKHTVQGIPNESKITAIPVEKNTAVEVNKNEVICNMSSKSDQKAPKNIPQEKMPRISNVTAMTNEKIGKKEIVQSQLPKKPNNETVKTLKLSVDSNRVPKIETAKPAASIISVRQGASSSTVDKKSISQSTKAKSETKDKIEVIKMNIETNPVNNNHAAVPFGKWTEANRQEFLNKFKSKVPATTSNGNQIKNSNDLNRRDVLKKIDSQRQTSNALSKSQEANKLVKNEAAFSKPNLTNQETKIPVVVPKLEAVELKVKPLAPVVEKPATKPEVSDKTPAAPTQTKPVAANVAKKEPNKRTDLNYQDLIDKTIEDMLHRGIQNKASQEDAKQSALDDATSPKRTGSYQQNYPPIDEVATLDAIEMKMNELHGIPFIERPAHELPQVHKSDLKKVPSSEKEKPVAQSKSGITKVPNLLPFMNKNQQKNEKDNVIEMDSEEEIIEHVPITGDIELKNLPKPPSQPSKEKLPSSSDTDKTSADATKKEAIITEKDFDKFARRNSITYENCLTVNFDGKEPHNVVQTVVEKELVQKSIPKNDVNRVETKTKIPHKYQNARQTITAIHHTASKFEGVNDEPANRNQSKLQKAYQSALTAKRQMECPITIIEDKPVKVLYIDNMEFVSSQLNVQGQDLSPTKKLTKESDVVTVSTCESLDSDMLDSVDDGKLQDEVKVKTKHQRKQVLTPVEEPELELIEPRDLGLEASPKKKRKTEDDKVDKGLKYPMRKKYYLLGSSAIEDKQHNTQDVTKNPLKETVNYNDSINVNTHNSPASAIDNLVKAAELLETQTENAISVNSPNPDSQQSTPVKRGRGRPRKYPLPDGGVPDKNKVPSPQKKPRLIDAKPVKRDIISDEEDSDEQIVKENWTMGKINENIVCPICNKLFRTENVVFKHVKHCTGPSPNRSDSDKRSPRRTRQSQESDDSKSHESKSDMDIDEENPIEKNELQKETPRKRKSKDSVIKTDTVEDVIVIEDTPDKKKPEKDDRKQHESRKLQKSKIPYKANDLVCEFCGKTFRQLSYLVNHKLQHRKEDPKKAEKEAQVANKSVYSCEVCKKEFRKLHHLVQHRIIHNPSSMPARSLRKSSSEQTENKIEKESNSSKQSEDTSAGFRCEPCDKSFRKLHHLVEHRETHDGINRQKTTTVPQNNIEKEKQVSLHTCDICKKTFRKLHHLIEHKEQHLDTGSEKSDDKSVKSSLSTKDIIHECSLCYMVFPNEHSLNKHTIICQRKKRQSKQKQAEGAEISEEATETPKVDEKIIDETLKDIDGEINKEKEIKVDTEEKELVTKVDLPVDKPETLEKEKSVEKEISPPEEVDSAVEPPEVHAATLSTKRDNTESINPVKIEEPPEVPKKVKKVDEKEVVKIRDTPKKKTLKDKATPTVSKRVKTSAAPLPVVEEVKPAVESSDDEDVRYMFNPNFKVEETEEKVFLKVRAKKRSSLQIERPNSKDLVKRRISLQHPPKIPRLKQKPIENATTSKSAVKTPKLEPVPSTDSDDSDIKYSFPKTIPEKTSKPVRDRTPKDTERKVQRKSLAEKRKSLSGIAKRKSLGKAATARHKPSPAKTVKRRTVEAEHRCDCGQLFSSAALLARHTSLAHTPPRIRRRRSPPPAPATPPPPATSNADPKPRQNPTRGRLAGPAGKSLGKASGRAARPEPDEAAAKSSVKPRKAGAHRGVPVPEKMRTLMQRSK